MNCRLLRKSERTRLGTVDDALNPLRNPLGEMPQGNAYGLTNQSTPEGMTNASGERKSSGYGARQAGMEPERAEESWLENSIFYTTRRGGRIMFAGLMIFSIVLSLLAFVQTGKPMVLFVPLLMLAAAGLSYLGVLMVPQYVRINEDGVQLRHSYLLSDRMFQWEEIKVVKAQKMPRDLAKKPERFLLTFIDRRDKKLSILPTPLAPDIFERIYWFSKKEKPNISWRLT